MATMAVTSVLVVIMSKPQLTGLGGRPVHGVVAVLVLIGAESCGLDMITTITLVTAIVAIDIVAITPPISAAATTTANSLFRPSSPLRPHHHPLITTPSATPIKS
jgi:hypothetical protein